MDEINKPPGDETTPNQSKPAAQPSSTPTNAQPTESRPPARAITSKRVVIPADAKRAAKRQPQAEGDSAPRATLTEPEATEPAAPKQEQAAAAVIAASTVSQELASAQTQPVVTANAPDETIAAQTANTVSTAADTRTLIPNPITPQATSETKVRGMSPSNLAYEPGNPAFETTREPRKRGNRVLEYALWGIAILLLLATAYFVVPLLFPNLFSNPGTTTTAKPTATAQAIAAVNKSPSPTTTQLPTQTISLEPTAVVATEEPLIIPTPPTDGEQLSLLPDGALSGWTATGDPTVTYADNILQAGTLDGKAYTGILQFNLRNLPTDSKILFAALELTGRDNAKLSSAGEWQIDLVENSLATDWANATAEQIETAKSLGVLGTFNASDLGVNKLNRLFMDATQLQMLEQQFQNGNAVLRIRGPQDSANNLFAWDSGVGGAAINAPTLHMVVIPGSYVVVTNTPAPRNVLTAAAYVVRGTDAAKRNGTPTPFSPGVATATPGGEIVEVPFETAVAGNDATAIARAQLATAIARTTGTYTPTPKGAVIIFPTFTPVVISPDELATATPIPPDTNLLDIPIEYEKCNCQGRIILLSNRYGGDKPTPIMIEPDGTELGKLSGELYYRLALAREQYSPDRKRRIIYPKDSRDVQQIGIEDLSTGEITFLTKFTRGVAYDGTWAPDGSTIAFISTEADNADQVYLYDFGTEQVSLLIKTPGGQPWFKRPTWSPDSKKIAYWSSISGTPQIWVMNRDGTNQQNISNNTFKELDPVWVK